MNPPRYAIRSATALALIGLALSALGVVLAEFTPEENVSWALAIPALATAGLVAGALLVIARAPRLETPLAWSALLWRRVGLGTAAAILLATALAAAEAPVQGIVMGLIAIQGPVAAYLLSRHLSRLTSR